MADPIFEDPLLVSVYDAFDGQRNDLEHYITIARELRARSVVDVGCGTGCLATRLVEEGFEVTAVDPALASIEFAMRKPNANQVRWIVGDATHLPAMKSDLAVMTGNVAQVFVSDVSWSQTLEAIRSKLSPNGHFVFETRDPSKKAWLDWTREKTYHRIHIENIGFVAGWCDLLDVAGDLISFRWAYHFEPDGKTLTSDSTLRFRSKAEIEDSLIKTGFSISEIRDAPDRPGKEFVFMARLR
jgi:SAM-dependent methyltransferase